MFKTLSKQYLLSQWRNGQNSHKENKKKEEMRKRLLRKFVTLHTGNYKVFCIIFEINLYFIIHIVYIIKQNEQNIPYSIKILDEVNRNNDVACFKCLGPEKRRQLTKLS